MSVTGRERTNDLILKISVVRTAAASLISEQMVKTDIHSDNSGRWLIITKLRCFYAWSWHIRTDMNRFSLMPGIWNRYKAVHEPVWVYPWRFPAQTARQRERGGRRGVILLPLFYDCIRRYHRLLWSFVNIINILRLTSGSHGITSLACNPTLVTVSTPLPKSHLRFIKFSANIICDICISRWMRISAEKSSRSHPTIKSVLRLITLHYCPVNTGRWTCRPIRVNSVARRRSDPCDVRCGCHGNMVIGSVISLSMSSMVVYVTEI